MEWREAESRATETSYDEWDHAEAGRPGAGSAYPETDCEASHRPCQEIRTLHDNDTGGDDSQAFDSWTHTDQSDDRTVLDGGETPEWGLGSGVARSTTITL